ncbi:hypothetical protein EVAR_41918_1 [Eumeta japonica]|uniref:Uncharacterized protein n=1 Tax=Eumeta variegata TaxID=151549 RepID=A0A4C1XJN8_EUMVA|nr:hypothetical protein EVAR_41918_1 [Eumeta japonica]
MSRARLRGTGAGAVAGRLIDWIRARQPPAAAEIDKSDKAPFVTRGMPHSIDRPPIAQYHTYADGGSIIVLRSPHNLPRAALDSK